MPASADIKAIRHRAAALSVIVGVLMLVMKMTAYGLTGSNSLLSDALESVVHVGATVVMYWCLRIAHRPPDRDHPYGHGKVEYLSVGFEGGMILLAGLAVFWEVGKSWIFGHEVKAFGIGLWLTATAALINLVLGIHLVRTGRRTGSKILIGDGHHVLSDVYTSAGALVGLALVGLTGLAWIDNLTAVILACLVLMAGLRLLKEAVSGLMDEADGEALTKVVEVLNAIHDPEWLDCHNLRLRTGGDHVFVDFHLVVPATWSVAKAHTVSEDIEMAILTALKRTGAVFVHLDHPDRPEYHALARKGGTWPLTVASATRPEGTDSDSAVMG